MAMPPPPAAPPAAPAMDAAPMSQVCVPIETLSMGSDGSKMVPPEVGDPVEFSATGTVSRVEGGNAYIDLETVNDQPMPDAGQAEPDESDMRAMAATADEEDKMPA